MIIMNDPIHPGIILKEEILDPLSLSITSAAKLLKTQRQNLSKIVNGKTSISVEMAFKIARVFNSDPKLWLSMQQNYDIVQVKKNLSLDDLKPYQQAG